MATKRKGAQDGAAIWTVLSVVWGLYSRFTTARDLATDAWEVRKLIADPPIELPWVLAALGIIVFLLTRRFLTDDVTGNDPEPQAMAVATTNSQSPVFHQAHSGTGDIIGIGKVENLHFGPRLLQLDDATLGQIESLLDHTRPVAISYANYGRTIAMKDRLVAFLVGKGFQIGAEMKGGRGYQPQPERPLEISPDGLQIGGLTMMGGNQVIRLDGDIPLHD